MYKIEVLVSTMYQKDFSLIKKMGLATDTLIINQCEVNKYEEFKYNENNYRMIYSTERGLSRSRNEALLHSKGDICLIADDDIKYNKDYEIKVLEAFRALPDADVIVFNTTMINYTGGVKRKSIKKIRRAPRYKNYGSVRIAFKRESFIKNNLWFNLLFGAGSIFGAGEESLLIREANKKGLKIYEYPANIAEVDYSTSTWFEGYNEKYFFDKGAFLAKAYPRLKHILKFYYIYRFRRLTKLSKKEMLKYIEYGFKGYKNVKGYKSR